MNTTPIDNNQGKEDGKKLTRAGIAAAVAAGAITAEAANLLYEQLKKEEAEGKTETGPNDTVEVSEEQSSDENSVNQTMTDEPNISSDDTTSETQTESVLEPEPEPQPEPEPEPEPEPTPGNESHDEPEPEPEPEPIVDEDDIVDVIVEEIDPRDIDMEDVLLVDEIGTIYMEDGRELNVAIIHDEYGNEAMMIDVDGDNVYDVIATSEGEIIDGIPGDIDVSDAELLYAQQHGDYGYMEQNDFDIAMNDENIDIQDDILLS